MSFARTLQARLSRQSLLRSLGEVAWSELEKARAQERLKNPPPSQSQEAEPEERKLPGIGDRPLLELIPNLPPLRGSDPNRAPFHLKALCGFFDLVCQPRTEKLFFWTSVPPGHWKTTTIDYGIIKHLARWPEAGVAYLSHGARFAEKQSRDIRRVCGLLGWKTRDDADRQDEWELETGGGLRAQGIGSVEAGRRYRLIIVDDPFKNREQANSPTERQKIFDAIEEDALPRLLPDGALLLNHTRWHPDDTIGRYRKQGWDGVNIRAITGMGDGPEYRGGTALLPEVETLEALKKILLKNPHKFFALYQGEPRPRGDTLFREPTTYEYGFQPKEGRFAYGVDLAYSEKSQAKHDFSVYVRMMVVVDPVEPTKRELWKYYITEVVRRQVQAPEFLLALKSAHSKKPAPMLWEMAGTEKGVLQFIVTHVPLQAIQAIGDPYQRAQDIAEAWNEGRVLIPNSDSDNCPDWVEDFKDEFVNFTGVKDPNDDQVVAAASAFKLLSQPPPVRGGGTTTHTSPLAF